MTLPEGKKRVSVTVTGESWDKVQALAKEAKLPRSWLSDEIDSMLPALIAVTEMAKREKMAKSDVAREIAERIMTERNRRGIAD